MVHIFPHVLPALADSNRGARDAAQGTHSQLFWSNIGLFWSNIGLFWSDVGIFRERGARDAAQGTHSQTSHTDILSSFDQIQGACLIDSKFFFQKIGLFWPNLQIFCERGARNTAQGTGLQRPTGCLIFIGYSQQKSHMISVSFAKNDLQLKAFYGSSPPCTHSQLFWLNIGLFWSNIGFFWSDIGIFCERGTCDGAWGMHSQLFWSSIGLFWSNIGLFWSDVGIFVSATAREVRILKSHTQTFSILLIK